MQLQGIHPPRPTLRMAGDGHCTIQRNKRGTINGAKGGRVVSDLVVGVVVVRVAAGELVRHDPLTVRQRCEGCNAEATSLTTLLQSMPSVEL